jgi:hypothetical protein
LEADPTAENLRKIADGVHELLIEKRERKQGDFRKTLTVLMSLTGCGILLLALSLRLKRHTHTGLQNESSKQ